MKRVPIFGVPLPWSGFQVLHLSGNDCHAEHALRAVMKHTCRVLEEGCGFCKMLQAAGNLQAKFPGRLFCRQTFLGATLPSEAANVATSESVFHGRTPRLNQLR